ncbi:MAG TPA: hypothetical protein VJV74_14145 [Terriglobia bacterium]|nr:hypothetical protein [Terriglobia bacterium]
MKLPNGERALVDIAKLRDYCLNEHHPRGRHKARVFAAALGLRAADAWLLREALLRAAVDDEAAPGEEDEYGQRYVVDFVMAGPGGRATVRSNWIVFTTGGYPRLTSCYVL